MAMKLAFERFGEGARPVLLLHGFMGSRHAWELVRPALEPHVHALAVDLPGHGESGIPPVSERAGYEATLEALAALVEGELGGQADVIGYSQGARLALALASRHPDRVRRLVMESGSPGLHARKERSLRREEDARRALQLEREGVERFVDQWEALSLFSGLAKLPGDVRQRLRARRVGQRAEGLAWALRSLGTGVQPDLWPALPHVRAPTLLLTGEDDPKYTQLARRMAAELPVVWRHSIPGCTHTPHLEAPAIWASEVLGFLSTPWYDVSEPGDEPTLKSGVTAS